jgi:hypothetical protein
MHASANGLILICVLALAGCADINSISRRSNLPSSTTVDGRAIHLDAKQRVVLAKAGAHGRVDMACAEPSPDALSAFASSVGGGISVSGQGAGSAASALSEAAASIGLRTQSITLMRDALYRVCEAYYNGAISEPQAMALLARSQDLTAAVVSVEQLTGAIVAKQAALGGAADASASAALLSNTQALTKMRELKAQHEAEAKELETQNKTAVGERGRLDGEIATKRSEVASAPDETARAARQVELDDLQSQRDGFDAEAIRTQSQLDLKREQIADMDKAITATAAQLDSATTSATASAASNASLSGGSVVSRLDATTAKAISEAVVSITNSVINKSYVSTECMALLTTVNLDLGTGGDATKLACINAIEARALAEVEIARAEQLEAKQRAYMIENSPVPLGP